MGHASIITTLHSSSITKSAAAPLLLRSGQRSGQSAAGRVQPRRSRHACRILLLVAEYRHTAALSRDGIVAILQGLDFSDRCAAQRSRAFTALMAACAPAARTVQSHMRRKLS